MVIIEILSDSTEAYDRGLKFEHYRLIDSPREYILVSQNRCMVERFTKNDDGSWSYTPFTGMEQTVKMESIECELSLPEVYHRVDIENT